MCKVVWCDYLRSDILFSFFIEWRWCNLFIFLQNRSLVIIDELDFVLIINTD